MKRTYLFYTLFILCGLQYSLRAIKNTRQEVELKEGYDSDRKKILEIEEKLKKTTRGFRETQEKL